MTRKRRRAKELLASNLSRIIAADERTLAEIAKALDMDAANLGKYLRGEKYPRDETLDRLVDALGVDHKEFFEDRA